MPPVGENTPVISSKRRKTVYFCLITNMFLFQGTRPIRNVFGSPSVSFTLLL